MLLRTDAAIPARLRHPVFVARPLTTADAAKDHAAYAASPDVIRAHSDGRWHIHDFTIEDDRHLIAAHEADHEARRAFTFLLLDHTETESIGCLYLNPLSAYLRRVGADPRTVRRFGSQSAMVTFWIRQDLQTAELPRAVVAAVNSWLLTQWPFPRHLFRVLPGERSSVAALEELGLDRAFLQLPMERRPYLWYQPVGRKGP